MHILIVLDALHKLPDLGNTANGTNCVTDGDGGIADSHAPRRHLTGRDDLRVSWDASRQRTVCPHVE